MKNFFKNLMPMLLLVAGLGISPNAWGATTFTKGETIFFYAKGTNSGAWESSACVKAWFNDGADKVAGTNWLLDIDKNGNKIFYVQVPCDGAKKMQVQRFASNCETWWNSVGDVNASDKGSNKNTITSWGSGASTVAWESSESGFVPFKFTVKGDVGNWETEYTLVDQLNGKFEYTLEFTPTESKTYAFKLLNSKTSWMGDNVSSPSLTAGATYDILLSYEVGGTLAVTATQKTFSVTASSADNNMGTVSPSSAWVGSSAVTFTATPNTGYHWTSWSKTGGASPSNAATSSVTATADGTITANFAANTYTVTLDNKGATTAGSASVTATYDAAMPSATMPTKTGYTFGGYYDADGSTSGNWGTQYYTNAGASAHVWDKTDDATLYAQWTEKLTSVTISSNGNGTVSPTEASVGVATTQSVTATPSTGYHFVSWAVTGNADIKDLTTTNPVTLYGNGSAGTGTLTATFAETLYTITITGGTEATTSAGCVTTGTATAAAAAEGKKFDKWELGTGITLVDCAVSDATITFHASQAATVTATYTDASKYNLNVVAGTGISAVTGEKLNQTSLPIESEITATLKTGYNFVNWTASGDGSATFDNETSTTTNVTVTGGSVTVTANAVAKTTTLTLHSSKGTPTEQTITATYDQTFPQDQGYTKPTCPGYTFNGYFITAQSDPDGTKGTKIIKTDASGAFVSSYSGWIKSGGIWIKEDAAKDLYAHWTANKSNQIELNKNFTAGKRTGADGKAYITFDATAFDAGFTHATSSVGFTLLGYSTDAEGTNMVVNADGTFKTNVANYTDENGKWINPTFPTKLYAQWEEFMTTVTLSANPEGAGKFYVSSFSATEAVVGISTTKAVRTAAIDENAYTFTSWTATNCSVENPTSSSGGKLSGDGTNATGTLVANFSLIPCNLVQLDGEKNGKTKNTFPMQYDVTKKAYYVDVTSPDASPFYYYFDYNNSAKIISTDWNAKEGDDSYKRGQLTALQSQTKISFTKTATIDVTGFGDKPSTYCNGSTSYPIRVWLDLANSKVWVTADFTNQWSLAGTNYSSDWETKTGTELGNWSTSTNIFGEPDGNNITLRLTLSANTNYKFKIVDRTTNTYLGNNGTIEGNISGWAFASNEGDCKLKSTEAGEYTFVWNTSTKKLSVTYPVAQTYTVTMANDGNGTTTPAATIELNEFTGTQISATPATGYHFDHWEGTTGIAFASTTSASTTATANQTGTITAHFAANTPIYFQNAKQDAWGTDKMYVYFYNGEGYWDADKGTGSNSTGKDEHGADFDKSPYFIAGPFEMTKISNTDIWEYAYDPTTINGIKGVVFADKAMTNYDYFTECNATRRMDFKDCANMFVLSSESPKETKNGTANYYSTGFWRGYNMAESKMYLHIREGETMKHEGEMIADFVGSDTYSFTATMESQKTYNLYVGNCTGMNFSNNVQITSENCSSIRLYEYGSLSNLGWIYTAAKGEYKFSLTFDDDIIYLSVEYPITTNDYRVKIGSPVRYSNIIRAAEASGTISMYLNAETNTFTYEEATNVDVSPIVWGNTKTITINDVEKAGVYTMTLTKGETPTITNIQPYTGKYYIRTDCAQGGWNEYKTNDNNLMQFTDRNPKFVNNPTFGFNYYYCRWNANASGNVRFVVANDINACISDTMKADTWLDNGEAMKGIANIRFGWNSNTNALSRAYIAGSFDSDEYIRILSNDGKIFEYTQEETKPVITAKKFVDENDWTYTMDVYADGGSQIAVSAKYNNKYQFFVGTGEASGDVTATEQLLKTGTKQHLRLVYDFKTDRLVSGWMPSDTIKADVILNADMLLARVGQGNADQINITTAGLGIKEIKTIYAVLQLDRDTMLNETTGINAKGYLHKNAIYWFSLPFNVKVNDIFGVDGYGTKWVLQYYDGAKRAKIGFFQETETFWTYLGINDTIKANIGYALCLDPDYFNSAEDAIWANNRQSVCFYFPSLDKNLHIVESENTITTHVPQHECTIDRTFGENNEKNHKITDTDWNVIGSPAFQNLTGTADMCAMHALYEWRPATNDYIPATIEGFTFKSTSAYLVQFHGDIKWQAASVINPTVAAPRYAYADEKNYTVELRFYFGDQWDRTYVALKDNANEDFVLNEDLTKMINAGQPNIYSYAGAYDVAYNGTTFKDQIVNLGVRAPKNGTYTFSMPKDFSGTAQLYDMEEGSITDLNVSNYSVDLNKGTYNNRFQLMLKVEASTPTSIETNGQKGRETDGKTQKLLINGNIYLINGGRVYNATGAELR